MSFHREAPAVIRSLVGNQPERWLRDGEDALPPFKSCSLAPARIDPAAGFVGRPGCAQLELLYAFVEGWKESEWGHRRPRYGLTLIRAVDEVWAVHPNDFEDVDKDLWESANLWCFAQTTFGEGILLVEGDAPVPSGTVVLFDDERGNRRPSRSPGDLFTAFVTLAESLEEWLGAFVTFRYDDPRLSGKTGFLHDIAETRFAGIPRPTMRELLYRLAELNPGMSWPRSVIDDLD